MDRDWPRRQSCALWCVRHYNTLPNAAYGRARMDLRLRLRPCPRPWTAARLVTEAMQICLDTCRVY